MMRPPLVILTTLVATSVFGQTSEDITWHESTGTYTIFYIVDSDTLDYSEFSPGNQIDPVVGIGLTQDSVLVYNYTLRNGPEGRPLQGIDKIVLKAEAELEGVYGPDSSWYARSTPGHFGFGKGPFAAWTNFGGGPNMIGVGDSLSGFLVRSSGPPGITSVKVQGLSPLPQLYNGPRFAEWDSLIRANLYVELPTLGPKDPPSPFDLGDFIDTVATYPSRASDLGWIDSTSVADQLQTSLDELSDDLAAGDSAHAAGLIERTLAYVESQKDSTLSSEAYALFRYNLEYAKNYLPDVFTLKLFTEGGYLTSTGLMKTTINAAIPQADTVFDDPGRWDYQTLKTFSDIPAHSADWAYVAVWDNNPGSKVYESTGLVDKYGLLSLPVETTLTGSYYLIVDHRNQVAMASDTLVDFTNGHAVHDFTTGHAYTSGPDAQETLISGQDTVYAMFAGDANADGQVTATDFNKWLTQSKAVAMGYINGDFNLDAQATATDFNYWLNNTKKVASRQFPEHWLFPNAMGNAPWTGGSSEAASKVAVDDDFRIRYRLSGSGSAGYANTYIDAKQHTGDGGTAVDTLGSATFDVYFNSDQMYYAYPAFYQDLLDAGYLLEINEGVNEHGSFVRVDVRTWKPDTVSYAIISSWKNLLRLTFKDTDGQITEHGLAMNLATMDVWLTSDGVYRKAEELVPVWAGGGFSY